MSKPQIYGIYWSRPQVQARQAESLTRARVFMNRLWLAESEGRRHFDPEQTPAYADRIRRRPPGSSSLGLSPHCDGGSVERWLDENFRSVYRHVFSGNWRGYDPFDAAWRPDARELPSPAVCSMFRTFQGWTALLSFLNQLARLGDGAGENICSALTKRALVDGDSESLPLKRRRRAVLGKSAGDIAISQSGLPSDKYAYFPSKCR
jgi:hypothetical protein